MSIEQLGTNNAIIINFDIFSFFLSSRMPYILRTLIANVEEKNKSKNYQTEKKTIATTKTQSQVLDLFILFYTHTHSL